METVAITSSSDVKSSTTTSTATASSATASSATPMEDHHPPETRDNCYFPGCQKDANCNCDICLASFNATLDLMPMSSQRSSLTKFSSSKPLRRSPVAFDPSILSTPRSIRPKPISRQIPISPVVGSPKRFDFDEMGKKTKVGEWGPGFTLLSLALCISLIFLAEFVFHLGVSSVLQPKLSPDTVRSVGEKFQAVQDLGRRLGHLQNEFEGLVHGEVSNCSCNDCRWKLNQDGMLLSSRCSLYKSATDEVSIWGWPLQTAGLLVTEFSSRSFTILSGRITEWPNGELGYMIRKANSSWVQRKWRASVVQLDPNTYVLEYGCSSVFENSRLFSAVVEFLKFWMSRGVGHIKQHFWQIAALGDQYSYHTEENNFRTPT